MDISIQIAIGWLLADALSGVGHAIGDNERLGNLKIVRAIVGKNVDHHADPLYIVNQGFIGRNLSSWVMVFVIGLSTLPLLGPSALWFSMVAGGLLVSEVHRWAHCPKLAPSWVQFMQRTGAFQSPRHHWRHHRDPYDHHFCLLTDYLNPIIDKLRRLTS